MPNRTSLTAGLKTLPSCGPDVVAAKFAAVQPSTTVPAAEQKVAAQFGYNTINETDVKGVVAELKKALEAK